MIGDSLVSCEFLISFADYFHDALKRSFLEPVNFLCAVCLDFSLVCHMYSYLLSDATDGYRYLILLELAERGSLLKLLRRRRGMSSTIRGQLNQLNRASMALPSTIHSSTSSDENPQTPQTDSSPQPTSPQDDCSVRTLTTQMNLSLDDSTSRLTSPTNSSHGPDLMTSMIMKMKQRSQLTHPEDALRPRDIYSFSRQIARGMEYLASQRVSLILCSLILPEYENAERIILKCTVHL